MTNLADVLSNLGFRQTWRVEGRTSIADLLSSRNRCGIYVLQFSNDEVYAGQAVDITRRFLQHRRTHGDIAYVSIKPVSKHKLNDEERNSIWTLENSGFHLRNITFTSVVSGETDFDLVMPVDEQTKWVNETSSVDCSGTRTRDDELRRKYGRKYQRFLQEPFAEEVVSILWSYVQRFIPVPLKSELSFWGVSCLPGSHPRGVVVYSRVNINWQEVFTVFRDADGLGFSWHLAVSPLEEMYGQSLDGLFDRHPRLEWSDDFYEPGGHDQINLFAASIADALALFEDSAFVKSARLMNLRLMRKGPCTYSRYHCFDLADRLLDIE